MEKNNNLNESFLEVLAESPLFREIEKKELHAMLVCLGGQIKEYKKGTSIFRWGDKISKIGFVLKGNVHVLRETYWGKESLLGRIGAGDLFGEVYACLPDLEFDGTVVAQTDCSILFLNLNRTITTCSSSCHFHTQMISNLLQILAQKNIAFSRKLDCLSHHTIRARLLEYFSKQAQICGNSSFSIPLNRQQLADYLCVDRSAMTVELYKLKDEGILDFDKNKFTLLE